MAGGSIAILCCLLAACAAADSTNNNNKASQEDILAEAVRRAILKSVDDTIHDYTSEETRNTISYLATDPEIRTARLGALFAALVFFVVLLIWCICVAVRSAFRWLVNLVLALAAIFLFFLILEYLSVTFGWLNKTSFAGSIE